MNLPIGNHLLSVEKLCDDLFVIICREQNYMCRVLGDWGHDAWIESIKCNSPGEILEVRDDGWHLMIRTTTGYNDIEFRAEWGYETSIKMMEMRNDYD